ncbi:MAG: hypothetical protein O3A87_04515 [Verrucomicrobia bacterium]|nr:hypothetical protein [Verrucomicrobiota bacterium]MDA1005730.1 hypothetical protein [Verrucomicrobiota bacterium]
MNALRLLTLLCFLPLASLHAEDPNKTILLPLGVHLVTGVEMVREAVLRNGDTEKTVMNMPVTIEKAKLIMQQVNAIWAPAGIEWVTDPEQGGGGIVSEKAGGGKLSAERLKTLAEQVVGRQRDSKIRYMDRVFPALADPANNETIGNNGTFNDARPELYHLYLFPYIGQTLQGTAKISGTFAIVGVFSDKSPNKNGFPKARPHLIPAKSQPVLSLPNFPRDGSLSATIAHELGHNLSLLHVDEGMKDNLMKGHVKLRLGPIQIKKAREQAMKGPRIGALDLPRPVP